MLLRNVRCRFIGVMLSFPLACLAAIPNDDVNYTGDRISFGLDVVGSTKDLSDHKVDPETQPYYIETDGKEKKLCIPARISFRGLGSITEKGLNVLLLETVERDSSQWKKMSNYVGLVGDEETHDCSTPAIKIPRNVSITIPKKTIEEFPPDRFGLTYGGLVVPYKYHFSGSKDFKGNATVGPYLGYRFDRNGTLGVAVKLVGFLGGAAIDVTHTVDGAEKTETIAGLSYGIGILGEIKSSFQLGLVFGADRVGKSSNYSDNGKIWGAFAIGFSFAN